MWWFIIFWNVSNEIDHDSLLFTICLPWLIDFGVQRWHTLPCCFVGGNPSQRTLKISDHSQFGGPRFLGQYYLWVPHLHRLWFVDGKKREVGAALPKGLVPPTGKFRNQSRFPLVGAMCDQKPNWGRQL